MMRKILSVMLASSLAVVAVPVQAEGDSWEESKKYIGSGWKFCGLEFQEASVSLYDFTGYCLAGAGFTVPESGTFRIIIDDHFSENVYGHYGYCTAQGSCPEVDYPFCNTISRYHAAGDILNIEVVDPIVGTIDCNNTTTPAEGTISIELLD